MAPIEEIAQWIQNKPVWWRHSVRLALRHGELNQNCLDEILHVARMENGLEDHDVNYSHYSSNIDFSGFKSEQHEVSLNSLSSVKGIAALAENQTLKFPQSGLFIVYGDNGAGKSSYASILKNACLTRGDSPEIIGNVFSITNPPPQAKISVNCDSGVRDFSWDKNFQSNDLLKSIRVFDSSSAHHYVNKEDSLGFKPAGFNLLSELINAINKVKAIAEEDIMPGNGLITLSERKSQSLTAKFINNISSETMESELREHVASPAELFRIEPLRQSIVQLKLQTAEQTKKTLNHNKSVINPLKDFCERTLKLLDDNAITYIQGLFIDRNLKQNTAEELRQATLQGLPLENVAGLTWQTLWLAAKEFIAHDAKTQSFPLKNGDICPLCLQKVGVESEHNQASLNRYLTDKTSSDAKDAQFLYSSAIQKIKLYNINLVPYQAALTLLESFQVGISDSIKKLFSDLQQRKELLCSTDFTGWNNDNTIDTSCISFIDSIINNITTQSESLQTDDDLLSLISKSESELQLIEDKKYALENNKSIRSNIQRYKIIKKWEKVISDCGTRQISNLASQLYRTGIVQPLIQAFNHELNAFGFNRFTVNVDSRNRTGQQQFKLVIAEANEPIVAKVASEGEQRCIAIASFLAEMKADKRKSAVIFDDPVNSLSHEWSRRVALRLVKESVERQVIIFTHNIVFYKLLLEAAESMNTLHDGIALDRSRSYAGIVRDSPPWEALTTGRRISYLRSEVQKLRRIDKEGTVAEFRLASRSFYGLLRECWERLVEEKLLNKVVTRFERGVATQRLSRLLDLSQNDIDRVEISMTKCSTYFTGHDSASEIGDPYPTIDEITQDLELVSKFLEELQRDRKRS